jgi:hypothetical protein
MIRQVFERIMREYPIARNEDFSKHPLANFIRHDVPEIFGGVFHQYSNLLWIASPVYVVLAFGTKPAFS